MRFLWGKNWSFISQKTAFFIVTAVKTSNLTLFPIGLKHVTCKSNFTFLMKYLEYIYIYSKYISQIAQLIKWCGSVRTTRINFHLSYEMFLRYTAATPLFLCSFVPSKFFMHGAWLVSDGDSVTTLQHTRKKKPSLGLWALILIRISK
jgi:hypothetical protein